MSRSPSSASRIVAPVLTALAGPSSRTSRWREVFRHGLPVIGVALVVALITIVAFYIYQSKKKGEQSTKDYFLAEGSLTWWAIGASMIASNISAEQFIGKRPDPVQEVSVFKWLPYNSKRDGASVR